MTEYKQMNYEDENYENTNVGALFLGPKSENQDFFKSMLEFLIDEHIHWRRDFHPADAPVITIKDMRQEDYQSTLDRTREILQELSDRMKDASTPWFSPRYLAHMNSDTLMVSNLAEMATILYNPNNVAYESSIATSKMEIECGRDFAKLMGYDLNTAWGHITTDGTVANYEALWLARNLKSFPLAVKSVRPDLVDELTDWELLNLTSGKILDLMDRVKKDKHEFEAVLKASSRGVGAGNGTLGKVLVPGTRHYSWDKAADILGIGVENLIRIPLNERYRMDLGALREVIDRCVDQRTPILALIAVVGTTEEGAVDEIAKIHELIMEYQRRNVSFYFHLDAAYGGYGRSLFLDENDRFMDYETLSKKLEEFNTPATIPSRDVWEAYQAMPYADSITIDPHKMGYIPYAAGGIVLKDRRVLGLISYTAAYVFESDDIDVSLGSVVLEGSKSGTAAAGVWAAHRLIPLNITGYGKIVEDSIKGARNFVKILESVKEFSAGDQIVICRPLLTDPDFNIVCMAFNFRGNADLEIMNELNRQIYHTFSYEYGPLYADEWITSHTELESPIYGESPVAFIKQLGITEKEWERVGRVFVLRSCVMHPWIAKNTTYPERWQSLFEILQKEISKISLEKIRRTLKEKNRNFNRM